MAQMVNLHLPDTLYGSVHHIAQVTDQSEETIILMILQSLLPALDSLSVDLEHPQDHPRQDTPTDGDKTSFYRMLMQSLPGHTLAEQPAVGALYEGSEPPAATPQEALPNQSEILRKTSLTLLLSLQR